MSAAARALALALLVVAAAAQHHHGGSHPDPFAGSGCNCSKFCAGTCAINATAPANMTLYRMTMFGVDDMDNKNTGDVNGDSSFVISRRTSAYECRVNPSNFMCNGIAQFTGDNPDSTDLVLQWTIEVDGQWGPYLMCNPTVTKNPHGDWSCATSLNHGGGGHGPAPTPAPLPTQCSADFEGFEGCVHGYMGKETKQSDLAACCAVAAAKPGFGRGASAFTYFANNGSCTTYEFAMGLEQCAGGVSAAKKQGPSQSSCNCDRVNKTVGREVLDLAYKGMTSMHPAGGIWYSHPENGECKGGHFVGDGSGCTWRAVSLMKAINATCLYSHLDRHVESSGDSCFSSCTKLPSGSFNVTSDCYLKCYSETITSMERPDIVSPWPKAFAGEDISVGGCPVVHKIRASAQMK